MNKAQEGRLAEIAKQASRLRETISTAEKMLRQWEGKPDRDAPRGCWVSLSSRDLYLNVGGHMELDVVERELIPALKVIRDQAKKKLQALALPL